VCDDNQQRTRNPRPLLFLRNPGCPLLKPKRCSTRLHLKLKQHPNRLPTSLKPGSQTWRILLPQKQQSLRHERKVWHTQLYGDEKVPTCPRIDMTSLNSLKPTLQQVATMRPVPSSSFSALFSQVRPVYTFRFQGLFS